MHSKLKGNIAQAAVVLELQKNEFNVFSEMGDYSKVDLIAEKNGKLFKIQVKFCGAKSNNQHTNSIILNLIKSGPNGYRYTYTEKDVDWFAMYDPDTGNVYWVKSSFACQNKRTINIHLSTPKNNQKNGINLASDFLIDKLNAECSG